MSSISCLHTCKASFAIVLQDLHNHVATQTAQAFVTSFLTRCLRTNIEHLQGDAESVTHLDLSRVLPRYKHSHRRLLLIDFEGTLWRRDPRERAFKPPAEALAVMGKLADDPRNEVWLLSGLPVKGALDEVAKTIPKVGLVCVLLPPYLPCLVPQD